jgi:TrmH family RNA methyltransferase
MKAVSSRANAAVKAMARLASSASERRKRGLTVLDGAHLVGAFLDARRPVDCVMVSRSALERPEIAHLVARIADDRVTVLSDAAYEALSTVDSATGVIAAVPTPAGEAIPADADLVLLLEDLQDPGNVGTLLRSAAAAGARHVALSPGCAFAWSLKTVRAGMGAHFALNIVEGVDLVQFLAAYRGTSVALAAGAMRSLYETDLIGPIAIVVGNEGAGLSAQVLTHAKATVRIPMPGRVESLNAGVAGSLCLFEALRQRSKPR